MSVPLHLDFLPNQTGRHSAAFLLRPAARPDGRPPASGVDVRLAWGWRSEDHDALVLVEADSENLQRLELWVETRPDHVAHLPGMLA